MSIAIARCRGGCRYGASAGSLLVAIWAVLITVPFWLPLLGGYTALAGRVLVFGLAAMGLNLLLGFTGVLSFGHAAYFGLGAYGAGLTLRYLVHSTPLAMLAGTLLGGLAGTLFGLLIVRRRGVYFAMCTIAFGQLWYYLAYSWNNFHRRLRRLARFSPRADRFRPAHARHRRRRIDVLFLSAGDLRRRRGLMGLCCARRSAAPWSRSARTSAARRFLGIPVERHIWLSFSISCFFTALAGTLYALLNNFADPLALLHSHFAAQFCENHINRCFCKFLEPSRPTIL